jgi:hypothetical protein
LDLLIIDKNPYFSSKYFDYCRKNKKVFDSVFTLKKLLYIQKPSGTASSEENYYPLESINPSLSKMCTLRSDVESLCVIFLMLAKHKIGHFRRVFEELDLFWPLNANKVMVLSEKIPPN